MKEIDAEKVIPGTGKKSSTQTLGVANSTRHTPLSESIICRGFKEIRIPGICADGSIEASGNSKPSFSHNLIKRYLSCDEEKLDGQLYNAHAERNDKISEAALCNIASGTSHSQEFVSTSKKNGPSDIAIPSVLHKGKHQGCSDKDQHPHQDDLEFNVPVASLLEQGECLGNETTVNKRVKCDSNLTTKTYMNHKNNIDSVFENLGCYLHPMPILSVLLRTKADEIYICVLCGSVMDKKWILFIYKIPLQGPRTGCPSFIGYASIVFPVLTDAFGREVSEMLHCLLGMYLDFCIVYHLTCFFSQITLGCSGLQLTPDGQSLVLLNCITVPCCRFISFELFKLTSILLEALNRRS